jgi:hypothetical protein
MITRQQPSSFLERHFFLFLCDLYLFSLSFLFTEVSEEECLFVDALAQSAAVEGTSEAVSVRNCQLLD